MDAQKMPGCRFHLLYREGDFREVITVRPRLRIIARVELFRNFCECRTPEIGGQLEIDRPDRTAGGIGGEGDDLPAGMDAPVRSSRGLEPCLPPVFEQSQPQAGCNELAFHGTAGLLHLRTEEPAPQV